MVLVGAEEQLGTTPERSVLPPQLESRECQLDYDNIDFKLVARLPNKTSLGENLVRKFNPYRVANIPRNLPFQHGDVVCARVVVDTIAIFWNELAIPGRSEEFRKAGVAIHLLRPKGLNVRVVACKETSLVL